MLKMAESQLSVRKRRAVTLLAEGLGTREVAAKVHAGERTVRRWLSEPAFRAELDALLDEARAHAVRVLRAQAQHAATALTRIVEDERASASARVSAAKAILELSLRDPHPSGDAEEPPPWFLTSRMTPEQRASADAIVAYLNDKKGRLSSPQR